MDRQMKTSLAAMVLVVLAVSLLSNAACTARKGELAQVRHRLCWKLSINSIPEYAALEEGYFAEEGIEPLITIGSGQEDAATLTAAGEYDMAVSSAVPAIMGIAAGMPIKVVAVENQRNPMCLIALSSSGIRTPQDIEGRCVGVYPQGESYPMWKTFVEVNNLDASTITEVALPFGLEPLIAGEVDVMLTYFADAFIVERGAGEPIVVFPLRDYAEVDRYMDCLIVNNKFAEEHPDLVRGFVRAYLRGMLFTINNPDKAADHLLAQAEELDEEVIRYGAEHIISLYISEDTKEHGLGYSTEEKWQEVVRRLVAQGLLEEEMPVEDIFTSEYLPDPPISPP